jgi:hypothetical protein
MDDATQDARLRQLASLSGQGSGVAPPSEPLLVATLDALRPLVFPQLRAAGVSGDALARQVVHGFSTLIAEAFASCGARDERSAADAFFTRVPTIAARLADDVKAAFDGDSGELRLLIKLGTYVHAMGNFRGGSALHKAARNGHIAVMEFLLKKGIDINAGDTYMGDTALSHAYEAGQTEAAEFLASRGAKESECWVGARNENEKSSRDPIYLDLEEIEMNYLEPYVIRRPS